MSAKNKKWSTRDAKAKFSSLIRASGKEPQIIFNRDQAICVVMDITLFSELMRIKEAAAAPTIPELLGEIETINKDHPIDFEIPPRINRPGSDDDKLVV